MKQATELKREGEKDYFVEYTARGKRQNAKDLYKEIDKFFDRQFDSLQGHKISPTLYWIKGNEEKIKSFERGFLGLLSGFNNRVEYFFVEVNLKNGDSNFLLVEGGRLHSF